MTPPKRYGLRIVDLAGSQIGPEPHSDPSGRWVYTFDPDGNQGTGDLVLTKYRKHAMTFATAKEAFDFYRQPSTTHPVRQDGMPNRPLTALSIEVLEISATTPASARW